MKCVHTRGWYIFCTHPRKFRRCFYVREKYRLKPKAMGFTGVRAQTMRHRVKCKHDCGWNHTGYQYQKIENVRPTSYQFIVKVMPSTINLLMSLGNNRHFHCRGRVDYRVSVLVLFLCFLS
jgi:hypothetical protein